MKSLALIIIATALWGMTTPAAAEKHALLIGISEYKDDRIPDLEGPRNDVSSMVEVLEAKWAFDTRNIITLLDENATESNILAALESMYENSAPGDDLLVYYSGHGTSAMDVSLGGKLHLPDGSGALISSDFDPDKHVARYYNNQPIAADDDGLLVGRYELKPLFEKLNRDRTLLVIFDACFSGNAVRGVNDQYVPKVKRLVSFADIGNWLSGKSKNKNAVDRQAIKDEDCEDCRDLEKIAEEVAEFDYENLIYFGAAAENQLAVDVSQSEIDAGLATTFDGKPHGGFTNALLHALWSVDAKEPDSVSYAQLFSQVLAEFQENCKSCGHVPVSLPTIGSDDQRLLSKSVFSSGVPDAGWTSDPAAASPIIELAVRPLGVSAVDKELIADIFDNAAATLDNTTPDVVLDTKADGFTARAADGALLKTFPKDATADDVDRWLNAQNWLKQRRHRDASQGMGRLLAEFRHPLLGNTAHGGELVFFTMAPEQDVSLIMLLVDSEGHVTVLHPTDNRQATFVYKAGSRARFPAHDAPQYKVTPPWGADNVLFYGVKPGDPILSEALELASLGPMPADHTALKRFGDALDRQKSRSSVSNIRFLSVE